MQVVKPIATSRPVLTNGIRVVGPNAAYEPPMVKKTGSSTAVNSAAAMAAAGKTVYGSAASIKLDRAIKERFGLPYHYGSTGPYSYDCSGFVWSVFQEAGINFTRTSAASIWSQSIPVEGDERFKFGTLVFFNGLGHVGIVADENGFYQASSSKGITYSPFKGYWENRIVGFRRLMPEAPVAK
jgi:peptidoglycan endopeptidase LytE